MPAAATKDMSTKLKLPTLPKDCTKRLTSGSAPAPGRSNASGGASTTGTPWATSMRASTRTTLPCVSCGSGKLETKMAMMLADTARAKMATIALAALEQVSARMPHNSTMAAAQKTTRAAIQRYDWLIHHAAE